MKNFTYRLLPFLILYFHIGAANANPMVFDKYIWTNRLVILITDKQSTSLEKQTKEFFKNSVCDIEVRNLKLLHLDIDEAAVNQIQKTKNSLTGLWLIGYDGSIKDFSEDGQLLNRLFQTIDAMPMRRDEMLTGLACD